MCVPSFKSSRSFSYLFIAHAKHGFVKIVAICWPTSFNMFFHFNNIIRICMEYLFEVYKMFSIFTQKLHTQ